MQVSVLCWSASGIVNGYNRGEIILARVPKKIMDALELTGFTPLFKIFDDVTAAVGSF